MPLRFALAGNPNSGKTTLFNRLTGSTAHVGNWPGVTVERRNGTCEYGGSSITVTDLPGTYSLSPYSPEEIITRSFIIDEAPELVIDVVDVTNIERNLYLTTELLETGRPVVVALNMMDEAEKRGYEVDAAALGRSLGVPVIGISAAKGRGLDRLLRAAVAEASLPRTPSSVLEGTHVFGAVKAAARVSGGRFGLFEAVKLLEGDTDMLRRKKLTPQTMRELSRLAENASSQCASGDIEAEIADLRYKFIERRCSPCVKKPKAKRRSASDVIDSVLTNRVLSIPFFILLMSLMFFLTFGEVGGVKMPGVLLQSAADKLISRLTGAAGGLLVSLGATYGGAAYSLVIDGVLGGVGAVLGFLPQILLLFTFISLLEGSGYMARVVFMTDRLFRRFGLSGKSFVPLIMGFGCSVPALMAARTIEDERARRITLVITPFMSCGAKLPTYTVMSFVIFGSDSRLGWTATVGVYAIGIAAAAMSAAVMNRFILRGRAAPFMIELPEYRIPSLRNLLVTLWEKAKHFLQKAGTVILISTVIIWFLRRFTFSLGTAHGDADSILGRAGAAIAPLFKPLGFGSWECAVAVLTGFIAKEMIVSTLGVLYGAADGSAAGLASALITANVFSPAAAMSFAVFNLLATPCVAATTAMIRELGSKKWAVCAVLYQLAAAWVAAFVTYSVGSLIL